MGLCGTKVSRRTVETVSLPDCTRTHHPVPNAMLNDRVENFLSGRNIEVTRREYALSKNGNQMFALLSIGKPFMDDFGDGDSKGITAQLAYWNSSDKTLAVRFTLGLEVMICSNMTMFGTLADGQQDTSTPGARHNRLIVKKIESMLGKVGDNIDGMMAAQQTFCGGLRNLKVSNHEADAFVIHAARETGQSRPWPKRMAWDVIQEWHEPSHDCYKDPTAWSLYNCGTEVLKQTKTTLEHQERLSALTSFTKKWFGQRLIRASRN